MSEKKSCCSGCFVKLLIGLVILAVLALVGFNIIQNQVNTNNNTNTGIFERKATINDLDIDSSLGSLTSIELNITPKVDIQDLELKIELHDRSGAIIKTHYEELGNVTSGRHYTVKISLFELGITNTLSSDACFYTVSRGCVSLFG